MENPDTTQLANQESEPPRKKLWHGVVAGLGCGLLTLTVSFLLIIVVVLFAAFAYFSENESVLTEMNADEILRGINITLAIVLAGSFSIAVIAGVPSGRTVYRHSADSLATRRLFTSIFAGLGIGVILFVIGFIGGLIIESSVFFPIDYSFGETAFSFMILIPTLSGIFAAIIGSLLGAAFVFRRLQQKNRSKNIDVKGA